MLIKIVSKNVQNTKHVQKYAKYETCAICTGFISCTFSRIFFSNFEINGYFHFLNCFFFFWGGGGGGVGVGFGGGDIGRFNGEIV